MHRDGWNVVCFYRAFRKYIILHRKYIKYFLFEKFRKVNIKSRHQNNSNKIANKNVYDY